MRFAFIHAEKAEASVSSLCRLLGVTRQGYYAYAKNPEGSRAQDERAFVANVESVFADAKGRYGSPRVHRELLRRGHTTSKRRVERAMKGLNLRARKPKRFVLRISQAPSVASNVLDRNFVATKPNERWVTDMTYLWTAEGWLYLAVIIDLYSRAVVGWATDVNLTTSLALRALDMAVQRRHPKPGFLHHSDQGCQYTGSIYRLELERLGAVVSMSRRGNCWDNAVAESFFATLKIELTRDRKWATRRELQSGLFEYLEVFYNRKRLHSTLAYRTPAEVEHDYTMTQAA